MTHPRHTLVRLALPTALAALLLVGSAGVAQAKVRSSVSGSLLAVTGGKGSGAGNDRVDLSNVGPPSGFAQRDLPGGFGHGTGAAADLGDGSDRYIGGASAFNLVLAGAGNDHLTGGRLRDSLQGGSGDDIVTAGAGRDILLGNSGNDKLNGGADDDLLSGNAGDDVLIGGPGTDLLGGGAGMDRLFGGPGADRLIGGAGKDSLKGGPGNNTLVQDSPTKK
jgi:Ca2+-binding RTX toxin-like protein